MILPLNLFLTIVGGCAIGGYLVRVLFPGNIILAGELFGGLAALWLLRVLTSFNQNKEVSMGDQAKELNSQIRKALAYGFQQAGRELLSDRAASEDLVTLVGLVFAELAEADAGNLSFQKTRAERDELRRKLSTEGFTELQRSLEEVNRKLTKTNMSLLSAQHKLRWFPSEDRPKKVPGLFARRYRLPDGQITYPDIVRYDDANNMIVDPRNPAEDHSRVWELMGPLPE